MRDKKDIPLLKVKVTFKGISLVTVLVKIFIVLFKTVPVYAKAMIQNKADLDKVQAQLQKQANVVIAVTQISAILMLTVLVKAFMLVRRGAL